MISHPDAGKYLRSLPLLRRQVCGGRLPCALIHSLNAFHYWPTSGTSFRDKRDLRGQMSASRLLRSTRPESPPSAGGSGTLWCPSAHCRDCTSVDSSNASFFPQHASVSLAVYSVNFGKTLEKVIRESKRPARSPRTVSLEA